MQTQYIKRIISFFRRPWCFQLGDRIGKLVMIAVCILQVFWSFNNFRQDTFFNSLDSTSISKTKRDQTVGKVVLHTRSDTTWSVSRQQKGFKAGSEKIGQAKSCLAQQLLPRQLVLRIYMYHIAASSWYL
jgi:hypothetical protein